MCPMHLNYNPTITISCLNYFVILNQVRNYSNYHFMYTMGGIRIPSV